MLSPDFIYALSGKILLLNTPAPPLFSYYHELVTKVCSVANQIEDQADKTFTSGVGLVIDIIKETKEDGLEAQTGRKLDLVLHVNHSDWDPSVRLVKSFIVKYIVPANPKLINTHIMIRVGREFFFDGFLAGWDLKEHMAVIKVLAFSPISMGSGPQGLKSGTATPNPSPNNRGRKFITFDEPDSTLPQGSSLASGSGSSNTAVLLQGPDKIPDSGRTILADAESLKVQNLSPAAKGKAKAIDNSSQPKKRRGPAVPETNA